MTKKSICFLLYFFFCAKILKGDNMKKGFTLVELLAVMVVLGLLVLLVVPEVLVVMNSSKQRLFELQVKNIELAAKNWAADNPGLLPSESGDSVTIFLSNLKIGGFIDPDISNPLTNSQFPNDMVIEIKRIGNSFTYTALTDTGEDFGELDYDKPTIVLLGALEEDVEINSDFTVSVVDVIAYAPDGSRINDSEIDIFIFLDEVSVPSIDLSALDVYVVEYVVTYNTYTESVIRTVQIVDTIPPQLIVPEETTISLAECATFDAEAGIIVSDNSGSYELDIEGTLSCAGAGTNYLEYVATDPSNNVTTVERTIIVE